MVKTFKLVAFYFTDKKGKLVQVPLIDALIINKENEENTWVIEIFIDGKHLSLFDGYEKGHSLLVHVIITKKDNDPAPFHVKLHAKEKIGANASILFEGTLVRTPGYAEQVLESLMDTGLSGRELLVAFQEKMKDKKSMIKKQKMKTNK